MKIVDTFASFPKQPNLKRLRQYHKKHCEVFKTYFLYHCQDTDERLSKAIERYSEDWKLITKVHQSMECLVVAVCNTYETTYHMEFPISVNLIIGAYGSNAYTHRKIIPDITFAMERLTPQEIPLKVIIAHEFGHTAHHIISDNHQMDWQRIRWEHPYIWLLQEGAATHFSRQIVPDIKESTYFSYDESGDEWLKFAREHQHEIIGAFAKDIQSGKNGNDIFKEWFSINGGSTFGYPRLAYFIADTFFQDYMGKEGELNTLLLWNNDYFFSVLDRWIIAFMNEK